MPTTDLRGRDPEYQMLEITAIMCFPSETESRARRDWILQMLLGIVATRSEGQNIQESERLGQWIGNAVYHLGGWGALANATISSGRKTPPGDVVQGRLIQGMIIGHCLKDALANSGWGIKTAAEQFCTDRNDNFFKSKEKNPPVSNPETIRVTYWPRYKDAAHLWVAYMDNRPFTPHHPHNLLPLDQFKAGTGSTGLKTFVNLSNQYLKKASKHFPYRSKTPILDEESCWKIEV